jgi:hypothetical protein
MRRRLVIIAVVAGLAALAFAAAQPPMASAASLTTKLRDQVTRQNLRVLQSYVEEWTLDSGGAFPVTADMSPGGTVGISHVWPKNPWTNSAMQQDTARGDFQYAQLDAGAGYSLRARLSGGRWFVVKPTTFPGKLQQLRTNSKDAITQRNVRVLQGYVDQWSLMNDGALPSADALSATGLVGLAHDYWPANPWTNAAMASGPQAGDFTYTPATGDDYTIVGHLSDGGEYTVTTTAPSLRIFLDTMRDRVVKLSVDKLVAGIELYALDNNDVLPASVSLATLGSYVDDWPVNPWTNAYVADSMNFGDYTYQIPGIGDACSISGHLSDGSDYTVSREWYAIPATRVRESLKNYCARYGVQVLKDYVDEWKAANGSLPTADQLSATADVGSAHTWWPVNPWTNQPMQSGDSGGGYYQYVDNGDGTFTLSVGQLVIPQRTPSDPVWPPSYTAQ